MFWKMKSTSWLSRVRITNEESLLAPRLLNGCNAKRLISVNLGTITHTKHAYT